MNCSFRGRFLRKEMNPMPQQNLKSNLCSETLNVNPIFLYQQENTKRHLVLSNHQHIFSKSLFQSCPCFSLFISCCLPPHCVIPDTIYRCISGSFMCFFDSLSTQAGAAPTHSSLSVSGPLAVRREVLSLCSLWTQWCFSGTYRCLLFVCNSLSVISCVSVCCSFQLSRYR